MREYQIKAERICSFARFVEWPTRKFGSDENPFVIGVYGTDEITHFLQEALQGRRIKDRAVVIKHIEAKQELSACHILFVSSSEQLRLPSILNEVRRESVLTVGESQNFLKRGGVINLVTIGGTVRFQLNRDAARRERLTISSKLLQLAIPSHLNPGDPRAAPFMLSPQDATAPARPL